PSRMNAGRIAPALPKALRQVATATRQVATLVLSRTLGLTGDAYFLAIAASCRRLMLASDSSRRVIASATAFASAAASRAAREDMGAGTVLSLFSCRVFSAR